MKLLAFTLLVLISAGSCSDNDSNKTETSILWVNSQRVPCEGVSPQQCWEVQYGETLNEGDWELFYTGIEGFDYEPGFIYKLKIEEEHLDPATVPADASSIKYTLIEILEKNMDSTSSSERLHDIWALQAINGNPIDMADFSGRNRQPVLEIFVEDKRIGGNDGCNNLFGQIATLTETEITFEQLGGTKMACPDMSLSNEYGLALAATRSYSLKDLSLEFYNADGEEVLRFKKVD